MTIVGVVLPSLRLPGMPSQALRRVSLAGNRIALPMTERHTLLSIPDLARAHQFPLYEVEDLRHPTVAQTFSELGADLIVVSCFPYRIPSTLATVPARGAINLHPSLLPHHRGPDPLFWVYRHDERRTGVTVHHVSPRLDAGPIIAQRAFDVPVAMAGDLLELRCAEIGGALLSESIVEICQQSGHPCAQDEAEASYETWPTESDLQIQPDWSAERAARFIRGVIPLGYRPIVSGGGERWEIGRLLGVSADETPEQSFALHSTTARIGCNPGWIEVSLQQPAL